MQLLLLYIIIIVLFYYEFLLLTYCAKFTNLIIGKNTAYTGFGTLCDVRHPLGSWIRGATVI